MTTDYDILIVGGGMVGASLACALAGHGLRIAVVEAVPFGAEVQPSYDDRAIALAYGTRRIFEGMGVWPALAAEAAPIREIRVSDRGRFGAARLRAADAGTDALGYVTEARVLGRALVARLAGQADIDVLCPATLDDLAFEPDAARARVRAGERTEELHCRLVVAADGAHSAVRERLAIPTTRWEYGQTAVIANVTPAWHHRGVAYERFTDGGPLALLPMRDERCAVVWTLRAEQAPSVLALDDQAFLARLQDYFGYRLGALRRVGRRHAYALSLVRAREHVRPRLALIGNAAHTLHPVAGQGFNLGLRDAAALAQILVQAAEHARDLGDPVVLEEYAAWRRRDHLRVTVFTDGLARLFANPLAPVGLARDLGLLAVDLLPPLKQMLLRQTMGLAGTLPRLARGLPL